MKAHHRLWGCWTRPKGRWEFFTLATCWALPCPLPSLGLLALYGEGRSPSLATEAPSSSLPALLPALKRAACLLELGISLPLDKGQVKGVNSGLGIGGWPPPPRSITMNKFKFLSPKVPKLGFTWMFLIFNVSMCWIEQLWFWNLCHEKLRVNNVTSP